MEKAGSYMELTILWSVNHVDEALRRNMGATLVQSYNVTKSSPSVTVLLVFVSQVHEIACSTAAAPVLRQDGIKFTVTS